MKVITYRLAYVPGEVSLCTKHGTCTVCERSWMTKRKARDMVERLLEGECDGRRAVDCRRILRDERMALQAAIESIDFDLERVETLTEEAHRVLRLWEGL